MSTLTSNLLTNNIYKYILDNDIIYKNGHTTYEIKILDNNKLIDNIYIKDIYKNLVNEIK